MHFGWKIEEDNELNKQLVGFAQYQVRKWTPWHRHVTACMLATAFLAVQRAAFPEAKAKAKAKAEAKAEAEAEAEAQPEPHDSAALEPTTPGKDPYTAESEATG
ncbi:hypothetical protein [Streptomyces sp. NPDC057909]|uniref:hypothetical protein n=1 Tax=Streptomyces sp. NPDC057909 TaxID=3346277 RepID=UPI0036ECFC87